MIINKNLKLIFKSLLVDTVIDIINSSTKQEENYGVVMTEFSKYIFKIDDLKIMVNNLEEEIINSKINNKASIKNIELIKNKINELTNNESIENISYKI